MSGIFDPRAEAERLVVVVENTAPGGSVFRVAVVGAPVSMSYSRSVAEGERAKAASRIKVALTAAFNAGASSRDAEFEALRGALAQACNIIASNEMPAIANHLRAALGSKP